jgi:hypothetical protein
VTPRRFATLVHTALRRRSGDASRSTLVLTATHVLTSGRRRRPAALRAVLVATAVVAAVPIVVSATPAGATETNTYYVGSATDNDTAVGAVTCEAPTNTVCTLRAAITDANEDGSGYSDTILISPQLAGKTITLTEGDGPLITTGEESLTLTGLGDTKSFLSGGGRSTCDDNDSDLDILKFTIENCVGEGDGGAIENIGGLLVANDAFVNDVAVGSDGAGGAIFSDDYVEAENDTFTDNSATETGGAINISGESELLNCTFTGNVSGEGGAVMVGESSIVFIENSTFVGNNAVEYGDGGAVALNGTSAGMEIVNSTFTNNWADEFGGAISNEFGEMYVVSDTISDNWALQGGGGIANLDGGGMLVTANILAGNSEIGSPGSGVSNECLNYSDLSSDGYNEVGPNQDMSCVFDGVDDHTNAAVTLGPLAHNGGPTETMAISDAAPTADDVPSAYCPVTDQRGDPRFSFCSAGAYQPEPTAVGTTCTTLTGDYDTTFTLSGCKSKVAKNTSVSGSSAALSNYGEVTWHPSGKKATWSMGQTEPSVNSCGADATTYLVQGYVRSSASAASPYFDKVHLLVCVATGSDSLSLAHKTVAEL